MLEWKFAPRLTRTTVLLIVLALGIGSAAAAPSAADDEYPEILSPKDGDRVPRQDEDPACPEKGPCTKIYVEGRVPPGQELWPFLAVAPLNAAPRIWVQPPITSVKRDGTFTGMVYLGTDKVGAGEKYNLLLLAHRDKDHFKEGQVLMAIPENCDASDPVTVLRTK